MQMGGDSYLGTEPANAQEKKTKGTDNSRRDYLRKQLPKEMIKAQAGESYIPSYLSLSLTVV